MKYKLSDGFPYYIELTENIDFHERMKSAETFELLKTISEEKATYRYAEGKWSIKQIIGHIVDHERIMTYRSLRFSRKDQTLLSGYDQDIMVNNSRSDELSFAELVADFYNVRQATLSFMAGLSEQQWQLKGKAWIYELSVKDYLRATIGHELHHVTVLKEKYLI